MLAMVGGKSVSYRALCIRADCCRFWLLAVMKMRVRWSWDGDGMYDVADARVFIFAEATVISGFTVSRANGLPGSQREEWNDEH